MLDLIMSGAIIGLLMASVFITLGELMLFFLYKNRTPAMEPFFERVPPGHLAMGIVALAYPTWTGLGALFALLFLVSVREAPGGGLGSPNLVFTVAVVVMSLMLAAPVMYLLRRVIMGVVALTVIFIGLFGWFLPYFVR